jgi:hypothetical protein
MTLTNQNCICKEVKNRLNLENACYHAVQSFVFILAKYVKVKVYKTIILPVVLCGCEIWSLTFREEYRLKVFESA